jgi:DNA-binding NtrC family response regulator
MKRLSGRGMLRRFFSGSSSEPEGGKDIKLLLVDDEERFLHSMEKVLTKKGYDVQTALSGEQGLSLLREKSIDVVVLDVRMPGLDGLETLRRITRYHPCVEVILLTGHGTVESAVEGLRCGAAEFLIKPISVPDLIEKVEAAFRRRCLRIKSINDAQSRQFMQQSPGDIIRDAIRRQENDDI